MRAYPQAPPPAASRPRRAGFLLAALALVAWALHLSTSASGPDYVLVIDAGSSGTRMYAYEWHAPAAGSPLPRLAAIPPGAAPHKVPRRALENRRAYKRVETEPGLDKFLDDPAALAAAALAPLLEWARAVVPRGRWARTPLLLFGTAGLRRLREGEQGRLLGAVRAALATSGFRFEPPWARVLTGADEAVFGWVGLNAAGGTLGTGRTVGALDLGGSSLEVAFAAEGAALGASSPGVNVSVLGARHTLFTHSHRHFGLDDAFERSVGLLLLLERRGRGEQPPAADAAGQAAAAAAKAAAAANFSAAGAARRLLEQLQGGGGALALEHPCLHQGYSQLYKRIPLDGRPPSPPEVRLSGGGDADACAALAAAVVAAPAACAAPPCALGAPQPRTAGAFVALSGFYVVRHFFGLPAGAGLAAVLDAGRAFCGQPWAAAAAAHPGELAVESYCFRAPYVGALVTQGLGLSQERVEIGDAGAGWTLGAALAEGSRLAGLGAARQGAAAAWWPRPRRLRPPSLAAAALLLGGVLLAAGWAAWPACRAALLRTVRTRLRRSASASALPLSSKAGGGGGGGGGGAANGAVSGSALFAQTFGSAHFKKEATPEGSPPHEAAAWQARGGGGGLARGGPMSRSQTFARRMGALSDTDR